MLDNQGLTVASTVGHDSNANGRAERAVLWFQEKSRTLLSSRIRSEIFQKQLLQLWTFAVQHVGEVHRREVFGEPACKYEFGQSVLARIKEPLAKFSPRMQKVIFLGFAPNVTCGYFGMRPDHKVELTSNIADDIIINEQSEVLQPSVEKPQEQPLHREEP